MHKENVLSDVSCSSMSEDSLSPGGDSVNGSNHHEGVKVHSAERTAGETAPGLVGQHPVQLRRGDLEGQPSHPRCRTSHRAAQRTLETGVLHYQQQHQALEQVHQQGGLERKGGDVWHHVLLHHVPQVHAQAQRQSVADRE